jgi:hypothetical protein
MSTYPPDTTQPIYGAYTQAGGQSADLEARLAVPTNARTVASLAAFVANNAVINVLDYGATGNGTTDDTAAINAAIAAAAFINTFTNTGTDILFPEGKYRTTSAVVQTARVRFVGRGRMVSIILADHDGDGVQSTFPINSSTAAHTGLRNIGILTTRSTNTGVGFHETGGSYVSCSDYMIQGFKHQQVLDQTELSSFRRGYLDASQNIAGTSCIWIVNGADFHAGASQNFSNGLSFRDLWLNSVNGSQLKDDGGVNHLFDSVNFNGGTMAGSFAGVRGLTMVNCASESHTANPFTFKSTSYDLVTAVGPCQGVNAHGNTFSDATAYHVVFTTIFGGRFTVNTHSGMTTAAYDLSADGIAQSRSQQARPRTSWLSVHEYHGPAANRGRIL